MPTDTPRLPELRIHALLCAVLSLVACGGDEPQYSIEDVRSFHEWLDTDRPSAAQLIAAARESGSLVVLSQDNALRGDTADLARSLLPALYDAGFREWGVYFMDAGRQDELDELVAGGDGITESEAAETAERLLFAADASLGYREYRDFLLYARDFNAGLRPEEPPLRIRALSSGRAVNPAALAGPAGPTGADLTDEVDGAGEGAGAETAAFSGVLWIRSADLPRLQSIDGPEGPAETYLVTHALPREGTILSESARRDLRDRTFAFEPASRPFGGWEPAPNEENADLVIVTPFAFRAVEPIPGFIGTESSDEAAQDFPELRMKTSAPGAAAKMNRVLEKTANRYRKTVERSLD